MTARPSFARPLRVAFDRRGDRHHLSQGRRVLADRLGGPALRRARVAGQFVAAAFAVFVLIVVARPADEDHQYGHDKAEYFSSGLEGGLILVAAVGDRRRRDRAPDASASRSSSSGSVSRSRSSPRSSIFAVARVLLAAGRRHDSITLEADAPPPDDRRLDVGRRAARRRRGRRHRLDVARSRGRARGRRARSSGPASISLRRSVLGLMDTALAARPSRTRSTRCSTATGERHPVPRAAHAALGRAPLRVAAPARAGRVDGAAGHDLSEEHRSRGARAPAQHHHHDAPRAARRPALVEAIRRSRRSRRPGGAMTKRAK